MIYFNEARVFGNFAQFFCEFCFCIRDEFFRTRQRYNNPGCLRYSEWQRPYGGVPGVNSFAKFPVYSAGKEAQLRLLRSAMSGKMPAYNANGTIRQFIYQY